MVPRALSQRRQYLLFFGLVVAVIGAAFALGRSRTPPSILDSVPRDAWLVATIDIAALRASPLAKPLLGAREKTPIPGLGSLVARCGFDPVARLREAVVTAPENGERGDFGLAFTGDFTKDELSKCAENVIRARGGSPSASTRGSFTLVEDTGDPAHARLAFREGGPFLVGSGRWLDAMIDATDHKGERVRVEHTQLRAALAGKGGGTPAIVVTALLPATVRDKLKAELGPELGGAGDKAYAGVLAVNAAGVAIRLTGGAGGPADSGASTTEVAAELRCETDSACDEVKKLVERKRLSFQRDLTVRIIGLGPLLDSLSVDGKGTSLTASAHASTDELARGIQRVIDFKSRPSPAPTPTPPQPVPAPGTAAPGP
jgi:hypothetical protein